MQTTATRVITAIVFLASGQACKQQSERKTRDDPPEQGPSQPARELTRRAEEQVALAREDAEKAAGAAESAITRARVEMEIAARKAMQELQRREDEARPQLRAGKSAE
jgi:hypothetical protein